MRILSEWWHAWRGHYLTGRLDGQRLIVGCSCGKTWR